VYPGVDIERFSSERQEQEGFRILFVGRFDREKGLETLLRAFRRFSEEAPETELWIVGPVRSGEDYPLAAEMARRYPVRILGALPREELPRIYAQCDLFCAPSRDKKKFGVQVWEEQFGAVFVEAMASALPIVATRCGAIPELLGEENLLVPQGSIDGVYRALRTLYEDASLLRSIGDRNRLRAEELFDVRRERRELENSLSDVASF
jgi:glycosyltransferase involved in cell wall biosynthesis